MKKIINALLLPSALLAGSAVAADLNFEDIKNKTYVTAGAANVMFDSDRRMDDSLAPFGGVGFQFKPKWAAELNYLMTSTDVPHAKGSTEFDIASLLGIYNYKPAGTDSIQARAGLAKYNFGGWDAGSETALRFGVGYDKYIQDNLSVNVFLDALYSFGDGEIDVIPGIGLKYYFGDVSKKSAPAKVAPKPVAAKPAPVKPVDTDKDGVEDKFDNCPNTAANIKVDAQGCELDDDKDGIVNSKDQCANTPMGAQIDAAGCRIKLEEVIKVNLDVKFANNSMEVSPQYHEDMATVAKYMKRYPDAQVEIQGHTDSRGSEAYNQKLSEKRAQAVMQYIINNFNVKGENISSKGYGESTPVADNMLAAGREKNRRVVAIIK